MTKDEISIIEKKIKDYFKNSNVLDYKKRIERLKRDIKEINRKIVNLDFNFEEEGFERKFSEVKNTNVYISKVEREMIKKIDELEGYKKYFKIRIIEFESLVTKIELENTIIENILSRLSDIEISIVKLKYKKGKSNRFIAIELYLTEPTLCRKIKSILNKINEEYKEYDKNDNKI